jgi:methionyl-tRNA formyltransferase
VLGVRLVFFGTPEDAVPALRALVEAGHEIALVVTQPDRRRSRGPGADPSPVKRAALELGLPVVTPVKAREVIDDVRASGAQLGVVVAFGQLLPPSLLEAIPGGFVNVHFSLLPRWRGAAPVERAILAGDSETGVCLMRIDAGLDTGDVFVCEIVPIGPTDTAGELRARLVAAGARLLVERLPDIPTLTPSAQTGAPTYAEKLTVDEFRLDPHCPASGLARVVRAGNPRPGAWYVANGHRYKVWSADAEGDSPGAVGVLDDRGLQTAAGVLVIAEIQPEGKRRMPYSEWRRGIRGALTLDDIT